MAPVTAATFCHGFVADQNAAVTRAFDVTATTPHLLGITPPAGAWRRGGIDGITCTTRDVTRHQTVAVRGSWHIAISITTSQRTGGWHGRQPVFCMVFHASMALCRSIRRWVIGTGGLGGFQL